MSSLSENDLDKIMKKISLNKDVKKKCEFFSERGGIIKHYSSNPIANHWDLLCLLTKKIDISYEIPFPYYDNVFDTEKIINDMKIRQLLEYYKIREIRPDNITTFLFYEENKNLGVILDYLYNFKYNLSIINPSIYKPDQKKQKLLKDQIIFGRAELSEFFFLHNFIQYRNEENIIEKLKRSMFNYYLLSKIDKPSFNKYFKKFGMKKEEILLKQEDKNRFFEFLLNSSFYKKEFSNLIDPIILTSLQWLNNLPNNPDFQQFKQKNEKKIRLYKFNFKETFGNQRLYDKDKIIDEIKKTRKLLNLPSISYD